MFIASRIQHQGARRLRLFACYIFSYSTRRTTFSDEQRLNSAKGESFPSKKTREKTLGFHSVLRIPSFEVLHCLSNQGAIQAAQKVDNGERSE